MYVSMYLYIVPINFIFLESEYKFYISLGQSNNFNFIMMALPVTVATSPTKHFIPNITANQAIVMRIVKLLKQSDRQLPPALHWLLSVGQMISRIPEWLAVTWGQVSSQLW